MVYTVYILESQLNGSYYVGQTRDLGTRLAEHNRGEEKSTKSGVPWRVVYQEEFSKRAEAIRRERQIKARKKRAYIDSLIYSERSAAR